MFELTLKSSKDVKRLVVEFGEDFTSANVDSFAEPVVQPTEKSTEKPITVKNKPKDMADLIAERASQVPTSKTKPAKEQIAQLPTIEADRPPKVDDSFTDNF